CKLVRRVLPRQRNLQGQLHARHEDVLRQSRRRWPIYRDVRLRTTTALDLATATSPATNANRFFRYPMNTFTSLSSARLVRFLSNRFTRPETKARSSGSMGAVLSHCSNARSALVTSPKSSTVTGTPDLNSGSDSAL